jgi:hypothetical protein
MFDEEAKMAENSKGDGQSMRHRFEVIVKEVAGVNFADFHDGRAMQGPACRRFLIIELSSLQASKNIS